MCGTQTSITCRVLADYARRGYSNYWDVEQFAIWRKRRPSILTPLSCCGGSSPTSRQSGESCDFHDPHLGTRSRATVQWRSGLQDLAFEVRAGERIGLVGPNGAGKTTLMQILAGQDRPDYGDLYRPARDPGQPAAAGARFRARRDADRRRQAGMASLHRPPARAGGGRPGDGRGGGRRRSRARRPPLRRAARTQIEHQDAYSIDHRVEEVLIGAGLRRVRVPPRRVARSPAASSRG